MIKHCGSFPPTGLEAPEELRKSDDDLLGRLLDSVERLEKRASALTPAQLYQLQRAVGGAVKKFQKEIDDMLVRDRVRKLGKTAKHPRTFQPGQRVLCNGAVPGTVRRHLAPTKVEVAFDTQGNDYGLYHTDELKLWED